VREFLDSLFHDPVKGTGALLGIVGSAIGITLGVRQLVMWIGGPEYQSATSRLIIIDASASMTKAFSPQSKFDSAGREMLRYVNQEPGVDVAVRFTSGRCGEPYEKPDVDFGRGNREEIETELQQRRQNLRGKANFLDAVRMGVNDFRESDTASSAKVRSIWLILGTAKDGCVAGRDTVEELKGALVDSPAGLSHVDFFALRAEKASFEQLKRRVESVAVFVRVLPVVQNRKALREKLEETARREAPSD
jgi:hypothetical protein